MAIRTDRLETRLSPDERDRIERAASVAGVSMSVFMVGAAVERSDAVIAAATTTIVPADYFDGLLVAVDEAETAPQLARAAKPSRRAARIAAR